MFASPVGEVRAAGVPRPPSRNPTTSLSSRRSGAGRTRGTEITAMFTSGVAISALMLATAVAFAPAPPWQLLPPPKDGEIRVVFWELRNESQVWLTLEPKTADGGSAPLLTFTHTFSGRLPGPPAKQVEVRAFGWAPSAELRFVLDDRERIELSAPDGILTSGTPLDYVRATLPVETLRQLARARRISGRALGVSFELSDSQRRAITSFVQRVSKP